MVIFMAKRYLHWVSPQLVVEFLATPQDDGAAVAAFCEAAATAWAATAESTAEEMARHRPPWAENLSVFMVMIGCHSSLNAILTINNG